MLLHVIDQRRRDIGGFEVGRVLPSTARRMVGPFVFFDHIGPVDFPRGIPRSFDVRPHPHIGLATVTYLLSGEIMHRDSVGSAQAIEPGAVNWMVAGRGITHSERFEKARAAGDHLHGLQSWVALPETQEETAPAFSHHPAASLPVVEDDGTRLRVIAGRAYGLVSPVPVLSPQYYVHADLAPGTALPLPDEYPERAAYVVSGSVAVDGSTHAAGKLLVFGPGDAPVLRATDGATVMLLGGEPVGPRYLDWNFVSSSRERIEQAKADWRAGRWKLPDLDDAEFIPLP